MSNETRPDLAYIGRKKECGCVVAATSLQRPPKEIAKVVAEWIANDLIVEMVGFDYVREHFTVCLCDKRPGLFDR